MSEHYESETDFKIGDDYQTQYESNYDDALIEFRKKIEPIKQKFEHHLTGGLSIADAPFVLFEVFVLSVKKMKSIADCYQYYDEENSLIEYDFMKELEDSLLDEYGWDIK